MIRRTSRKLKEDTRRHLKEITEMQEDPEEQVSSESEEENASVEAREIWSLVSGLKVECNDEETIITYLRNDRDEPKNQENLNICTRRRGRKKKAQKTDVNILLVSLVRRE
ncbi:hypothetical protein PIB30_067552 [Stylosanthes scabra]|uniref:Uncharacterized protein n=1 Tax=Stylosanthes scabra TaxID=79078 RepID=A0ABU6UPC1_9FABA|nr:hypothetical protein [Stylosanthes scabra]